MMNHIEIFTIGVYGSTEEVFFKKLLDNKIDTFCDIRQRRAVRGSAYAFVNSQRLQTHLKELGINYFHIKELAPPIEIRRQQQLADKQNNQKKRTRTELGSLFVKSYNDLCLSNFDSKAFVQTLTPKAHRIVLFCVEQSPLACHRHLVALKLKNELDLKVIDL
ncbi:MAG: DUF488 domain-containing protein [Saprospiraceae bacterium]|nr:DUF488 domain-containing protein [Saprospiraceae bacterium]